MNIITKAEHIENIKWQIFEQDSLNIKKFDKLISTKFDFVIGNPPYIKYTEIPEKERIYLRENYGSCKEGKFDYCYPFIERNLDLLNSKGKMVFLIPSSIFKNVFAKKLRDIMVKYLTHIYDYTTKKLFTEALTSSAIVVFDKSQKRDVFLYHNIVKEICLEINKNTLREKWIFESTESNYEKLRFGGLFQCLS